MNQLFSIIDSFLNRFLQLLLVLITVVVTWQVFSRYVLGSPSSFTEELARFLLIWLTLLGCVFAYRQNSHLGLDMLYTQAVGLQKRVMYYFIHVCVAAFALCVMVIGGYLLMNMTDQLGQSSAVMGIGISYVYMIVPISGILIVVYALKAIVAPEADALLDAAEGDTP
jgi:TRAP-type C4-dicarboxylate transport system permease small subunit